MQKMSFEDSWIIVANCGVPFFGLYYCLHVSVKIIAKDLASNDFDGTFLY